VNGEHRPDATRWSGAPLARASRAMILLHGRGAPPEDVEELARHLHTEGMALAAPAATGRTWYPRSFLAPESENQPWLDSALALVHGTLDTIEAAGITPERTFLLGFSQGACLSLESVARRPCRYGGVFALSGGLIGLGVNRRDFPGDLAGTPVVMGCSDVDPHIPRERFEASARVLVGMGADVRATLYPGFGHAVNQDEIDQINGVLDLE